MVWYILAWFPMLVLAILNGAVRDFLYKDKLGELRAHQVSTLTAMILFAVYVYLVDLLRSFSSGSQAMVVGIIWVIMTIVFEFCYLLFGISHLFYADPVPNATSTVFHSYLNLNIGIYLLFVI